MVDEFKLENKQVFLASGDSSPPRNTAKDVGAHVFRSSFLRICCIQGQNFYVNLT